MTTTNQDVTNIINKIEVDRDLFDLPDHGPLWDYVRIELWEKVRNTGSSEIIDNSSRGSQTNFSKILKNTVIGAVKNNPLKRGDKSILFHGFSRRSTRSDGLEWCIHCDPLIENTDISWAFIENPNLYLKYRESGKLHDTPAKTPQVDYTDFFTLINPMIKKMGLTNRIHDYLGKEIPQIVYDSADQICSELNADISLEELVKSVALVRAVEKIFYEKILRRVDPLLVIAVNRGRKLALFESCEELGIPTVLLQQGAIYDSHIGFSYQIDTPISTIPDYLFTFGEFWNDMVNIPIPDKNIRTVGWPYLEQEVEKYRKNSTKNTILVLSQPHIGGILSTFAAELAFNIDNYDVVFKPHPNVGELAPEKYPELDDSPASIIHDRPLYELFSKSEVQIGYSSTAIFEGIRFGLDTYIVEGADAEHIDRLLDTDAAIGVKDPDQICQHLRKPSLIDPDSVSGEQFFKSDPLLNINCELEKIMSSTV